MEAKRPRDRSGWRLLAVLLPMAWRGLRCLRLLDAACDGVFLDRSPVPCRCARRLLPRANRRCRTIMADKPDKTNKLKPRLPRGLADRGGAEIAVTRRMLDKIRAVYERYGFEPMEALGLQGQYIVKVNNRKVLDGVLESIGLAGEADAGKRLTVLRAIDKLDRLGQSGVRALLAEGRKDESGDFTRGAKLRKDQIESVLNIFGMPVQVVRQNPDGSGGVSDLDTIEYLRTLFDNPTYQAGLNELADIAALTSSAAYGADSKRPPRIIIDTAVVRGLEYYTGPVYEVDLTFDIKDEAGRPVRFGSVAAGGRYDGLIARFRGEPVPATSFSIGVSRLTVALQHLGKIESRPEAGQVAVTVFPDIPIAHYQRLVVRLRDAEYAPGKKVRAERYLGDGKFAAQKK